MKLKDDKRRLIIKGKEGKDYHIFSQIYPLCQNCCFFVFRIDRATCIYILLGSFHVKSSDFWPFFHGPPPILLKFGTLVELV